MSKIAGVDIVKVSGNQQRVRFEKPYPEDLFRENMSYRVKGWFFIKSVKNGMWDGYITMLKRHSITTGLYRAIKPSLEKHGITFKESITWGGLPPVVSGLTSNWGHQNECVDAMVESVPQGGGTILAATSSGKTRMYALFCSRVEGNHLFIVDQRKLLHQARKDIAETLGEHVGIVGDSQFDPGRVTVATVQTLRVTAKLEKLARYLGALESVTVDELHVQLARSNFDVVTSLQPRARFGLTATLQEDEREVWLRASEFSGPVIYRYPIERGMREGILSKVSYHQIVFSPVVTETEIKSRKDDIKLANEYKRDAPVPINVWKKNVLTHPTKHKALRMLVRGYLKRNRYVVILADKLKHIDYVARLLYEFDPMVITGQVKQTIANDFIECFERGENRLIIASRVFNKGVSIKRIDTVINIGEMEDANTIVQQIGRELRLHDDKDGAIFVDFGTTTGRFGKSARERLKAVQAAGIPAKRYQWDRDRLRFFESAAPPKQMTLGLS